MTPPSTRLQDRFVSTLAWFIAQRAGWVLAGTLAFIFLFIAFLPRVTARNDTDDFIIDRDPSVTFHKEFRKLFGKEDFIVIATQREDLFTERRLNELKALTDSLLAIPEVEDVTSLANVVDFRGTEDSFQADAFLLEVPSAPKDLERLRRRAAANPLYRRTLVSPDGKTTAIIVFTQHDLEGRGKGAGDSALMALNEKIRGALAPYEKMGYRFYVAGWPVTNVYLAKYMHADSAVIFPISFLLIMLAVWYVFKNVRLFLLAGAGILLTLVATLGLGGMLNIPLNNASMAAIPLVMSLALSDIVHLFTHLDRQTLTEAQEEPRAALAHVLKGIFVACLLTSINTGIGFASFTLNSVAAIRSFGVLAAAGMFFEFVVTFGVVAPLLVFLRTDKIYHDREAQAQRGIPRFVRWIHEVVTRRPVGVLVLCLAALLWGGWAARTVVVNTNLENFFKPDSPVRRDIDFVRNNLTGMEPFDLSLKSTLPGHFKDPAVLAALDSLEDALKALPEVNTVTGLGDYFKEMNKAFHAEDPREYRLPKSRRLLEQYLLLYGRDDLEDYVTADYSHARVMIRANVPNSQDQKKLIQKLKTVMADHPIPGVTQDLTGTVVIGVKTIKVMVDDQVMDILSTVAVIFVMMLYILRSWGLTALFLVPNLFPLAINFGIMGSFGIPLDTGTSLVAASAFGIIVDDTVHFFVTFREKRLEGKSVAEASRETSEEKGESAVSSFLVLIIAFGVTLFSHFRPIQFFGLLNLIILLVGLAGDQLLLKSILALWGRRGPPAARAR